MVKAKRIILAGYDFSLDVQTGDKIFWQNLVELMAKELEEILIISIRQGKKEKYSFKIGNCQIHILFLQPLIVDRLKAEFAKGRVFWSNQLGSIILRSVEKFIDGLKVSSLIKRINENGYFSHVHLMDNFGLANREIGKGNNYRVSVSAVSYKGISEIIYDRFLRLSYSSKDLIVVTYSASYREKLKSLGIPAEKIIHIPWGIKIDKEANFIDKNEAKKKLSLPLDRSLFLWAGYIQQIQKKDLMFAYEIARKAIEKGLKASFYFALKPESVDEAVLRLNGPQKDILFKLTSKNEFLNLMRAADIFFSPISNKKIILAPPLTWLEALKEGLPILTTRAGGVEEVIENGQTGYIAENKEDLLRLCFKIIEEAEKMRSNCFNFVKEKYNLDLIAKKYLSLFSDNDDLSS